MRFVLVAKRTEFFIFHPVRMLLFVFGIGVVSSLAIHTSQGYYFSDHLILSSNVFVYSCVLLSYNLF